MKMLQHLQLARKVGLAISLLVVSILSSSGSDLIPVIDPEPLVNTAMRVLTAKHPEIPESDLKLALIQCVYDFSNDFDPREKAADGVASRKAANAVLTFAVLSTRRDSSDSRASYAEYEAWKVVVAADGKAMDAPVEKTGIEFSRGK